MFLNNLRIILQIRINDVVIVQEKNYVIQNYVKYVMKGLLQVMKNQYIGFLRIKYLLARHLKNQVQNVGLHVINVIIYLISHWTI